MSQKKNNPTNLLKITLDDRWDTNDQSVSTLCVDYTRAVIDHNLRPSDAARWASKVTKEIMGHLKLPDGVTAEGPQAYNHWVANGGREGARLIVKVEMRANNKSQVPDHGEWVSDLRRQWEIIQNNGSEMLNIYEAAGSPLATESVAASIASIG